MSWTFTWGFSLSRIAISQVSSACKLIPPSPPHPNWQDLSKESEKRHFPVCFPAVTPFHSPTVCLSVVHTLTHTELYPVVNVFTYAIQLAGYFCLCEWAAVSLSKLWAPRRESCESQSLTSRDIPSLHPKARWLISAEYKKYFIIRFRKVKKKKTQHSSQIQMPCGHKLPAMRWQEHKTKSRLVKMDSIIRHTGMASFSLQNRHQCSRLALQIGIICVLRASVGSAWSGWWLKKKSHVYLLFIFSPSRNTTASTASLPPPEPTKKYKNKKIR